MSTGHPPERGANGSTGSLRRSGNADSRCANVLRQGGLTQQTLCPKLRQFIPRANTL